LIDRECSAVRQSAEADRRGAGVTLRGGGENLLRQLADFIL